MSWRTLLIAAIASTQLGHAQPSAAISTAVKSPEALRAYLQSNRTIEWGALWETLGVVENKYWVAPCGADFPVGRAACAVDLERISRPDQALLTIRGDVASYSKEYLRYVKLASGGWRFAGEFYAFQKDSPSEHTITTFGSKPFLMISSDHSQVGMATEQKLEDWFDLSGTGLDPVFSITVEGSEWRWGMGVGRTIQAAHQFSVSDNLEKIHVTLKLTFDGIGLAQEATYSVEYERGPNEKKFGLRRAYLEGPSRAQISPEEFTELADPFSGVSNDKLVAYAIAGLRKVATGPDKDARDWLTHVLGYVGDTPEKRELMELLRR
jgi:hypothetical protein